MAAAGVNPFVAVTSAAAGLIFGSAALMSLSLPFSDQFLFSAVLAVAAVIFFQFALTYSILQRRQEKP
jgi:hypothetical protein